ncbi:hypothetical protein BO82DRAFT_391599 [Aspergillus uvarum CBS 121591]|uniref:Rhodopsin domain-containing protein n=1 Tax=Aspergillus uvarum CBS 121591 TaxID=1448315 RepID=A0A319CUI8_9EURO|nr:hypothetical protein BO82DRAFT_391599 [Aspergillus uvarum CBS 121591]PYH82493.1 hypothetical protein BO82DRAFT_391599 [Aspergillus uvarum CBS 121591]
MLLSVVFLFATCGLNLTMIHYGTGPMQTSYQARTSRKSPRDHQSVHPPHVRAHLPHAELILGSIAVGWVLAIICVSVFKCDPIVPGSCINLKGSFIGNAVPNDVAILSRPVHVVWGLHASLTHRLSVIAVFLLGSFVVFSSAYRFSTLFQFEPADTTWALAKACTWCLMRVRERDHLRLSADPAAAARGVLGHVCKQRRRLGRAHHGHQG